MGEREARLETQMEEVFRRLDDLERQIGERLRRGEHDQFLRRFEDFQRDSLSFHDRVRDALAVEAGRNKGIGLAWGVFIAVGGLLLAIGGFVGGLVSHLAG